jgi:hypothetical protein
MTLTKTRQQAQQDLRQRASDTRIKREREEMLQTKDLREIDDDVEDLATLLEWEAPDHVHRPKSAIWYTALAILTIVIAGTFVLLNNVIGAITVVLLSIMLFALGRKEPEIKRYRIMVDGIAVNETLYHFRDLVSFNLIYEPSHTTTILFRSNRHFAPLLHMEIGDSDPTIIRDVLLEVLPEDLELDEPITDIYARKLGW